MVPSNQPNHQNTRDKFLRFSDESNLLLYKDKASDVHPSLLWYTKEEIDECKEDLKVCVRALLQTDVPDALELIADSIGNGGSSSSPEIIQTVVRMTFEGQEHMRGLESIVCQRIVKQLVRNRRAAIRGVLNEQAVQRMQRGIHAKELDDASGSHRLAQVSHEMSSFAKKWSYWVSNLKD